LDTSEVVVGSAIYREPGIVDVANVRYIETHQLPIGDESAHIESHVPPVPEAQFW
jgi:hypothetical protein